MCGLEGLVVMIICFMVFMLRIIHMQANLPLHWWAGACSRQWNEGVKIIRATVVCRVVNKEIEATLLFIRSVAQLLDANPLRIVQSFVNDALVFKTSPYFPHIRVQFVQRAFHNSWEFDRHLDSNRPHLEHYYHQHHHHYLHPPRLADWQVSPCPSLGVAIASREKREYLVDSPGIVWVRKQSVPTHHQCSDPTFQFDSTRHLNGPPVRCIRTSAIENENYGPVAGVCSCAVVQLCSRAVGYVLCGAAITKM